MTIEQILEVKAIREVHIVWFVTDLGERFFMGEYAHNYCKMKDKAFAYTKMLEAEKRCLGLYDEVKCQDIENIGVDTIYVGDGITIG
mgnify:CR=1 FL=1